MKHAENIQESCVMIFGRIGRVISKGAKVLESAASNVVHDVSVPTLDTPQSGLHDTRHFTLGNTMFD